MAGDAGQKRLEDYSFGDIWKLIIRRLPAAKAWQLLAGAVGVLVGVFFLGRRTSPMQTSEERGEVHAAAGGEPIALIERYRDAFVVPFQVTYRYPENLPEWMQPMVEKLWTLAFKGRVSEHYDCGGDVPVTLPDRALFNPARKIVSSGTMLVGARFDEESDGIALVGRGWYKGPVAVDGCAERDHLFLTWGIDLEVETPLTPKNLRHGALLDVRFVVHGAGNVASFSGQVTLDEDTWIRPGPIDLAFENTESMTSEEEQSLKGMLQGREPVATVDIGQPVALTSSDWGAVYARIQQ